MVRYISLYYVLPAVIQLLLISVINLVLYETGYFLLLLRSQFVPWLILFVFIRTVSSVFMKDDILGTTIGFTVASLMILYNFKTWHWPGQQTMLVSMVFALAAGLSAWLIVQRKNR